MCLAPFLQRREEEKKPEWRWFKGIVRTIKEEGKGNKGSKRNSSLFQQVNLVNWLCGGGVHICMFSLEGQQEEMQINSLSSQVNAISFHFHLIISVG